MRHSRGRSCLSAALRDLYEHHGVRLLEHQVFGLGCGPCLDYMASAETREYSLGLVSPCMDVTLAAVTGVRHRLCFASTPERSTEHLVDRLTNGVPVALKLHPAACPGLIETAPPPLRRFMPAHWVVVVAYDAAADAFTFVDNRRQSPYVLDRRALEEARYAGDGDDDDMYPRGVWMELEFPDELLPSDVGYWLAVSRMVATYRHTVGHGATKGLDALARLGRHLRAWGTVLTPAQRRDNALRLMTAISVAGGAKGACRPLYATFLAEAADVLDAPGLVDAAARFRDAGHAWQRLHAALGEVAAEPDAAAHFARGAPLAHALDDVLATETAAIDATAGALPACPPLGWRPLQAAA
jgi:hypothetical protein